MEDIKIQHWEKWNIIIIESQKLIYITTYKAKKKSHLVKLEKNKAYLKWAEMYWAFVFWHPSIWSVY